MRQLASQKGDNIIAILDCCHSGGMGRDGPGPNGTPRALFDDETHVPLPETLDQHIRSWHDGEAVGRDVTPQAPTGFAWPAMRSHVLLAACLPEEKAIENRVALRSEGDVTVPSEESVTRGLFTLYLLAFLRRAHEGTQLSELTYADLTERLAKESGGAVQLYGASLDKQHPICEGYNKDRLLFSLARGRKREPKYAVTQRKGEFWVYAGSAVGVMEGSRFAVVDISADGVSALRQGVVILEAKEVWSDRCKCTAIWDADVPPPDVVELTDDMRAIVLRWSPETMHVWTSPGVELPANLNAGGSFAFSVVYDRRKCDVSLELDESGTNWILTRFDPLTARYAKASSLTLNVTTVDPWDILGHVAHWNFHMYRYNTVEAIRQQLKVRVELYRLKETDVGLIQPLLEPEGADLFEDVKPMGLPPWAQKVHPRDSESKYAFEKLEKEAIIEDITAYYGLAVRNESDYPLFVYVFYFDPNDCGIQKWYPPDSYDAEWRPLPKRQRKDNILTIGYGEGGIDPLKFELKDGDRRDTGFLKIFVSMSRVDMDFIQQDPLHEQSAARHGQLAPLPVQPQWCSSVYALTVHGEE
ncbi:uncharacterized protein C8Q71DRAFT_275114 [Rhodofomes roseus]|uniref:Caspase domain-containing protein n=1 Tax=Rhodofomes roseus TaxID=34475 RepID=A0ABQ8K4Z5_9APHY|nr:uncharacterized protein C8Q71DRAFT_275114 [Rhodofomes roseus]KAH9831968.1 hypothetical protein C8Q71DRAFT_275114 [Rhodofomes roseus]